MSDINAINNITWPDCQEVFGRTPAKSIIPITTEKKGVFVELSLRNWQGLLQPLIQAGCLTQWKAYKFADVVWKAQMSTLFTTAPRPCKRNNWSAHLLSWAKYSFCRTKNGGKVKDERESSASESVCADIVHLFSLEIKSSIPVFYRLLRAHFRLQRLALITH